MNEKIKLLLDIFDFSSSRYIEIERSTITTSRLTVYKIKNKIHEKTIINLGRLGYSIKKSYLTENILTSVVNKEFEKKSLNYSSLINYKNVKEKILSLFYENYSNRIIVLPVIEITEKIIKFTWINFPVYSYNKYTESIEANFDLEHSFVFYKRKFKNNSTLEKLYISKIGDKRFWRWLNKNLTE